MAKQERAIITREALIVASSTVFARLHFETARVADILEASSVTQGAFYFHFPGGKKEIAKVVIERQIEQFTRLCDEITAWDVDGLSGLLALTEKLGAKLQSDPVAQAGIRMVLQSSTLFPDIARLPDPGLLEAITTYLQRAEEESVLRPGIDVKLAARTIIYLFTGAQVTSFVNDTWSQLPNALSTVESFVLHSLAVDDFVRSQPIA